MFAFVFEDCFPEIHLFGLYSIESGRDSTWENVVLWLIPVMIVNPALDHFVTYFCECEYFLIQQKHYQTMLVCYMLLDTKLYIKFATADL